VFVAHLYIDQGKGFDRFHVVESDYIAGIGRFELEFNVEKYADIKNLRFDPVEGHWCAAELMNITYITGSGQVEGKTQGLQSNAWIQEGNRYHFESFDPQVVLHDLPEGTLKVRIRGTFQMFDDSFKETRMQYYRSLVKRPAVKKSGQIPNAKMSR